jgi:hypothetical protein
MVKAIKIEYFWIAYQTMTDTPQHIKDLQLKLWMSKTEEERLLQFLTENEIMYQALRKFKIENNLPLYDLDPLGEYLTQKTKRSTFLNEK